jgi:hypothetical protein
MNWLDQYFGITAKGSTVVNPAILSTGVLHYVYG